MKVQEVLERATDAMSVKRVFGEPLEKNGVTIVPVAKVGGGGGGGSDGKPEGEADGGGFGLGASPAGAFVIKNGNVSWQPAIDLNRVILGCQVVAIFALIALRTRYKSRGRKGK